MKIWRKSKSQTESKYAKGTKLVHLKTEKRDTFQYLYGNSRNICRNIWALGYIKDPKCGKCYTVGRDAERQIHILDKFIFPSIEEII